ncbi:MAG TPA: methyltransferase [Nostocaceae cyanobacterium]|nr:methyltransferase [Nostocaceae cyanobacterium]
MTYSTDLVPIEQPVTKGNHTMNFTDDLSVGNGLNVAPGTWEFDAAVAVEFNSHVAKSVPLYYELQTLAVQISDFFIPKYGLIIDLGCSTGTTIIKLLDRHQKKNLRILGIDNSAPMIAEAHKILDIFTNVQLEEQNIVFCSLPKAHLIYSLYSLQFIDLEYRQSVVEKIYNSLHEGGAFILVEKVLDDNSAISEIYQLCHWENKQYVGGFNPSEILGKAQSLRGRMRPLSTEENLQMLKDVGFRHTSTFFKWCNFVGILAVK